MSYPQPNADTALIKGWKFFRLNTPLVSPGDIYESAQGAHAFALGPESDISRVAITYFDNANNPTFIDQLKISPDRSFIGRIDAHNETTYQPANRPGRVLIAPDNLYNPLFNPFDDADEVTVVPPFLDVIQYFTPPQSLVTPRIDKEFYYQQFRKDLGVSIVSAMFPYFGRKSGSYSILNASAHAATVRLCGVNFLRANNAGTGFSYGYLIDPDILPATVLASGDQANGVLKESTHGMFDYIALRMEYSQNAANDDTPFKLIVSDKEL